MMVKTTMRVALGLVAGAALAAGCMTCGTKSANMRVPALPDAAWGESTWIRAADAKVAGDAEKKHQQSAAGTSWFASEVENADKVVSAKWMVTGLGVFEAYVNGERVGTDALKPGFTHVKKTRRSFTYDVTPLMKTGRGERNELAAEVSAGWWRDKIVNYTGQCSGFRGVLEVVYADGTTRRYGTGVADWKAAVGGPVQRAAIFDGEVYDARVARPAFADMKPAVVNGEFQGEILPSAGGEICRRCDRVLAPVEAYCWKGVEGAGRDAAGKAVHGTVVKTRVFDAKDDFVVEPGETLVIDFGQNCAGVPRFAFAAAAGTTLTCLPGEMLNDQNGERSRGNDGPGGSLYRENLRMPADGMRLVYTFAGDALETYMPRFTFFGYRYLSITATDAVTIKCVRSVPVTSIAKEMELGSLETGCADVNQLISNVYWGQLSNYLSVPTDCPQRNERLGWTADTQVFCEAGTFNADTSKFFHKWMRDMVDSRDADGGFPSVAPFAQYGNETFNLGWADAGVIVPWTVWKQFGDVEILRENWDAMARFVRKLDATKYKYDDKHYTYADWLSYETFETCGNKFGSWAKWSKDPDARNYREFLAACYWLYDSRLMVQMAQALGRLDEAEEFRGCAKRAMDYIRATYVEKDGLLLRPMRGLQTACVFALKFGVVEGAAYDATKKILLSSIEDHGNCLQTGFLGTGFLMDVLTQIGASDVAYTLLLQHKNPSWLYSVDQGATTIWERWNSYVKDTGFGPVGMNSFNHYAYGAVLAWMYKSAAGIAAYPCDPGFKTIEMAPKPDRRLGYVKAEYRSAAGLIKSAWRYDGDKWIWDFTVPEGATARVTAPGETKPTMYAAGTYRIVK